MYINDSLCYKSFLFRTLTEQLKLPGETECMVRGSGHQPVRSNEISGHLIRTNNGEQTLNKHISCGDAIYSHIKMTLQTLQHLNNQIMFLWSNIGRGLSSSLSANPASFIWTHSLHVCSFYLVSHFHCLHFTEEKNMTIFHSQNHNKSCVEILISYSVLSFGLVSCLV